MSGSHRRSLKPKWDDSQLFGERDYLRAASRPPVHVFKVGKVGSEKGRVSPASCLSPRVHPASSEAHIHTAPAATANGNRPTGERYRPSGGKQHIEEEQKVSVSEAGGGAAVQMRLSRMLGLMRPEDSRSASP
jgi:hypothetical protein